MTNCLRCSHPAYIGQNYCARCGQDLRPKPAPTGAESVRCSAWLGRVLEAGTADDGSCRVIIETTPEQLRGLDWLPFYQDVLVTFSRPNEKISDQRP